MKCRPSVQLEGARATRIRTENSGSRTFCYLGLLVGLYRFSQPTRLLQEAEMAEALLGRLPIDRILDELDITSHLHRDF
jgi:hypothetical protein